MTTSSSQIREWCIAVGSLFNEPMRVETVRAGGDGTWTAGNVRTQSELFRKVSLAASDIHSLTILDSESERRIRMCILIFEPEQVLPIPADISRGANSLDTVDRIGRFNADSPDTVWRIGSASTATDFPDGVWKIADSICGIRFTTGSDLLSSPLVSMCALALGENRKWSEMIRPQNQRRCCA